MFWNWCQRNHLYSLQVWRYPDSKIIHIKKDIRSLRDQITNFRILFRTKTPYPHIFEDNFIKKKTISWLVLHQMAFWNTKKHAKRDFKLKWRVNFDASYLGLSSPKEPGHWEIWKMVAFACRFSNCCRSKIEYQRAGTFRDNWTPHHFKNYLLRQQFFFLTDYKPLIGHPATYLDTQGMNL